MNEPLFFIALSGWIVAAVFFAAWRSTVRSFDRLADHTKRLIDYQKPYRRVEAMLSQSRN